MLTQNVLAYAMAPSLLAPIPYVGPLLAAAWITANLTAGDLLTIQPSTVNGISSQVMTWSDHIPAAKIDPLRQAPELATLIAAFEAIGATA